MKQIGLRFLYKHLGQALQNLPFEITNHNKVVAVVITKEEYEELKEAAWKYEDLNKWAKKIALNQKEWEELSEI